jgi:hypothetical protein
MSSVFEDDNGGIGSHNLHLLSQQFSVCKSWIGSLAASRILGNGKKKRCPPVGVWGITGKQIGALPKDGSSQQSGRTFFQGLIR